MKKKIEILKMDPLDFFPSHLALRASVVISRSGVRFLIV